MHDEAAELEADDSFHFDDDIDWEKLLDEFEGDSSSDKVQSMLTKLQSMLKQLSPEGEREFEFDVSTEFEEAMERVSEEIEEQFASRNTESKTVDAESDVDTQAATDDGDDSSGKASFN
ncbi:MAG: hypothetical protein MHM6MM_007237 [Cercozoa sp. M6MM]